MANENETETQIDSGRQGQPAVGRGDPPLYEQTLPYDGKVGGSDPQVNPLQALIYFEKPLPGRRMKYPGRRPPGKKSKFEHH